MTGEERVDEVKEKPDLTERKTIVRSPGVDWQKHEQTKVNSYKDYCVDHYLMEDMLGLLENGRPYNLDEKPNNEYERWDLSPKQWRRAIRLACLELYGIACRDRHTISKIKNVLNTR